MTSDQLSAIASSRYLGWALEASSNPSIALDCSEISDHMISMASDHGIRAFRSLPITQRRSATIMFRSIARSITDENMSKVRERLLRAIRIASRLPPERRQVYIKRALSSIGVYGEDKNVIETVTRTQSSIADAAATWIESYSDPDVWGFEYVAKANARPSHRAMHGVRYPKHHRFWRKYFTPNGWNCRCRCRPIRYGSSLARTKPFIGTPDVDPGFRFNAGRLILGAAR